MKLTKVPKNGLRLSSANVLIAIGQFVTQSTGWINRSHLGTKKSASKERISKAVFITLSVSPLARPIIPGVKADQLVAHLGIERPCRLVLTAHEHQGGAAHSLATKNATPTKMMPRSHRLQKSAA